MNPHQFTPLLRNQPPPDPSREGSRNSSVPRKFPSWEGSGVGPWAQGANYGRGILTRRDMLRRCACGFGYLALTSLLAETARVAAAADNNPLAPRPPHFPPRAKRIIFLFMPGGPSQVDTFDPKPLLARDRDKAVPTPAAEGVTMAPAKLLASPWEFKKHGDSGVEISSLFPQVANFADDLCIIRSLHTNGQAHGQAIMKLHTGSENQVRPSMGAWVLYGLGTENQNLPGFITISPPTAIGGPQAYGRGRADGNEARQVLIFSSQTVENPRTHAGPNLVFRAGVQLHYRLPVRLAVCVQAADDAEIIRKVGHLGKQAADLDATVAIFFELPRRRQQFGRRHRDAFSSRSRKGFIPVAREQRFGIEGVHLRRPAGHGKKNDALGARRKMRWPRCQGIVVRRSRDARRLRQQARQCQIAKAARAPAQHVAASENPPTVIGALPARTHP